MIRRDCASAQSHLSIGCSLMVISVFSRELVLIWNDSCLSFLKASIVDQGDGIIFKYLWNCFVNYP